MDGYLSDSVWQKKEPGAAEDRAGLEVRFGDYVSNEFSMRALNRYVKRMY
jgi:hypothetical protein